MTELIPLDQIHPNPWQPRGTPTEEHIIDLARSIRADGLLQTPVGRRNEHGIELAFGHSRLAAYRILAGSDVNFSKMPVELRELIDEEMARIALAENLERRDLSPIEQARAMKRYQDDFNKTSDQVGDTFGLSGATVRGKLRLLDLPDEAQAALSSGSMSEGAARELLTLWELPESIRSIAERAYNDKVKPSYILRDALQGELAPMVASRIDQLVEYYGQPLSKAPWKWAEILLASETGAPQDFPACKGCPKMRKRGKVDWCTDRSCFAGKEKAWDWRETRKAALMAGYPAFEEEWDRRESASYTALYAGDQETLKNARSAHCPNLRVMWLGRETDPSIGGLGPEGYPKCTLICTKRAGFCTCQKATRAGIPISEVPEKPATPVVTPGPWPAQDTREKLHLDRVPLAPLPAKGPTAAEMVEISRDARRKEKANVKEVGEVHGLATRIIEQAIDDHNPAIWRMILNLVDFRFGYNTAIQDIYEELRGLIAERVADQIYNRTQLPANPDTARRAYDAALERVGLKGLYEAQGVSAETTIPKF